jgi:hypothetical protein
VGAHLFFFFLFFANEYPNNGWRLADGGHRTAVGG